MFNMSAVSPRSTKDVPAGEIERALKPGFTVAINGTSAGVTANRSGGILRENPTSSTDHYPGACYTRHRSQQRNRADVTGWNSAGIPTNLCCDSVAAILLKLKRH
jgi:hypothetical protein